MSGRKGRVAKGPCQGRCGRNSWQPRPTVRLQEQQHFGPGTRLTVLGKPAPPGGRRGGLFSLADPMIAGLRGVSAGPPGPIFGEVEVCAWAPRAV